MLTGTDLFAGGGGSSTGMRMVPGVEVSFAANHWEKIVGIHALNHPAARHACADISQMNPRYYPRTTLAWISPSCTKHTKAQGRKREPWIDGEMSPDEEAAERSRATMLDVPRWAEYHEYRAIIVENVEEVQDWRLYEDWWRMMTVSLGYRGRVMHINSAHAGVHGQPAPTNRNRWYAAFTRPGDRQPDFDAIESPPAICDRHGLIRSRKTWKPGRTRGVYGAQYTFTCPSCGRRVEPSTRTAEEIIDWTLPAPTIGSRRNPLASKTMDRIGATVARYWWDDAGAALDQEPLMIEMRGGGSTGRPASEPLSTISAQGRHHGLLMSYYGSAKHGQPTDRPIPTITTKDRHALVTRSSGMPADVREYVDSCGYRMITPPEQAAGMDFPPDYRWDGLTGTEQTMAVGNAVTPPVARDLVWAIADALGGAA